MKLHFLYRIVILFICTFHSYPLYCTMYHFTFPDRYQEKSCSEESIAPFNEMIISWNGSRPIQDTYLISFRLRVQLSPKDTQPQWTPWMSYALWGCDGQASFCENNPSFHTKIDEDVISLQNGFSANGFQVKVSSTTHSTLPIDIRSLHIYTEDSTQTSSSLSAEQGKSTSPLNVPQISQLTLQHPRNRDLCSPTSLTSALSFLMSTPIDPLNTPQEVWDKRSNIFGNWVFNTAYASTVLGSKFSVWVERLSGFDSLYAILQKGLPVIVSIRGTLKGALIPYKSGHLIVIRGYNHEKKTVLCMDPAYPDDSMTYVEYDLDEFMEAWKRRRYIAYIFHPSNK